MNSPDTGAWADGVATVLQQMRSKGVQIWSQDGELRYRAPKGALTPDDVQILRASRAKLVSLLQTRAVLPVSIERAGLSRRRAHGAPLTFTQLAHWHTYQLYERPAIRQVASATRLYGDINFDAFRQALEEVVSRHESLRTRIILRHGTPIQEVSCSVQCDLPITDLSKLSQSARDSELERQIQDHILIKINIAVEPLFGIRLVRCRDDEHVLIVAMEHMISDGVSMNIFLRDILAAYSQAVSNEPLSFPAMPIQFNDYAIWQHEALDTWLTQHGPYWRGRLAGCRRLRFPEDRMPVSSPGWASVPLHIDKELKRRLDEWCRWNRTTIVMSIFTAYAALVLRWCNASEGVILYQTDGRECAEVEQTIGYFASVLCLRVSLLGEDRFSEFLNRVTDEYCQAYKHSDHSYIQSQVPRQEFTHNCTFNWVPSPINTSTSEMRTLERVLTNSPILFVHPMLKRLERDSEPSMVFVNIDDEITGSLEFPLHRFSVTTMQAFGRNLLRFIGALLERPDLPIEDIEIYR